jgi:hypothetical protein
MTLAMRRVHPPLPDSCPAHRFPSYRSLRAVRQRHSGKYHCASPRTARRADPKRPDHRQRRRRSANPSLPALRRPHDHHRDLRARLLAALPSYSSNDPDQDRYLMITLAITALQGCCSHALAVPRAATTMFDRHNIQTAGQFAIQSSQPNAANASKSTDIGANFPHHPCRSLSRHRNTQPGAVKSP